MGMGRHGTSVFKQETAGENLAGQGKTRHGAVGRGPVGSGEIGVCLGMEGHGEARRGRAWLGIQGAAGPGENWYGGTWLGGARHGKDVSYNKQRKSPWQKQQR